MYTQSFKIKKHRLVLDLTADQKRQFKAATASSDESMTDVLKRLINGYLEAHRLENERQIEKHRNKGVNE